MDTIEEFGTDYFPLIDFQMGLNDAIDAYLGTLDVASDDSSSPYNYNTSHGGLDLIDRQEYIYTGQNLSQRFFQRTAAEEMVNDSDGSIVHGIMSDFDGSHPHTPSHSIANENPWTAEISGTCIRPTLLQYQSISEAESTGTPHVVSPDNRSISPCPLPQRKILPRPAGHEPLRSETYSPPKKENRKKKARSPSCALPGKQRQITKSYACEICAMRFSFSKSLERHYTVWHKEYAAFIGLDTGKHFCPYEGCSKKYTRSDNLTRHVKKVHDCVGGYT